MQIFHIILQCDIINLDTVHLISLFFSFFWNWIDKWMNEWMNIKWNSHCVTLQNKMINLIGWATNEAVVWTYSESSFVSSVCSFSLSECSLDRYCLRMLSSTCVIVYFLNARYCMRSQTEEEENRKREKMRKKRNAERIGLLLMPKSFKM